MNEENQAAIQREGFAEEGFAAFKDMPAVPYPILRIRDDGMLKLRGFLEFVSPCDMISVPAPQ